VQAAGRRREGDRADLRGTGRLAIEWKTSTGPSHNWKPACSWPSASTTRLARRACSITWAGWRSIAVSARRRPQAGGGPEAGTAGSGVSRLGRRHLQTTWPGSPEGERRKYVALTRLHDGKIEEAEEHLHRGEELLRGVATCRVWPRYSVSWPASAWPGRRDEAMHLLRQALVQFDSLHLPIEATRTQFELAQAMAEAKAPGRLVVRALQDALQRAEACRRGELVARIEESLKAIDEEAHWRHIFRRVRGHGAPDDTTSLNSGVSEPVSILSLELVDFESYCQGLTRKGS